MLQTGFVLLSLILALAIIYGIRVLTKKDPTLKTYVRRTAFLFTLWAAYIVITSMLGIYDIYSLPPRVPILLVLPTFIFMIYFFSNKRYKALIAAVPQSWPIYFQSFRILVELLIYGLFAQGLLAQVATFEGYNFDIFSGITAPVIAYLCITKKLLPKWIALLWNFAALIVLGVTVFCIVSSVYLPGIWHLPTATPGSSGLGTFPYTLLAGILMPMAVFMHVLSLKRLLQKQV